MDFLTQQELTGIKHDLVNGQAMQAVEKMEFERKLREGLGQEMKELTGDPKKLAEHVKAHMDFAKKYERKKKTKRWKENLRKILGLRNQNQ